MAHFIGFRTILLGVGQDDVHSRVPDDNGAMFRQMGVSHSADTESSEPVTYETYLLGGVGVWEEYTRMDRDNPVTDGSRFLRVTSSNNIFSFSRYLFFALI